MIDVPKGAHGSKSGLRIKNKVKLGISLVVYLGFSVNLYLATSSNSIFALFSPEVSDSVSLERDSNSVVKVI